MKTCSKCYKLKKLTDFVFRKDRNKYRPQCKQCIKKVMKKSHKIYYENNKDKVKKHVKNYCKNNKEKIAEQNKIYHENNKNNPIYKEKKKIYSKNNLDKIREYKKQYQIDNKEELAKKAKQYRIDNKEEIAERKKIYGQNNKEKINKRLKYRRQTNPNYKLKCNLASRIQKAIKNQSAKKADHTIKLFGCSVKQLKQHLEKQFTKNMNWNNYGTYWHVDHIIPCAKYNLTLKKEQYKCFNYRNLRPLEAIENISKQDKIDVVLIRQYDILDLVPA